MAFITVQSTNLVFFFDVSLVYRPSMTSLVLKNALLFWEVLEKKIGVEMGRKIDILSIPASSALINLRSDAYKDQCDIVM